MASRIRTFCMLFCLLTSSLFASGSPEVQAPVPAASRGMEIRMDIDGTIVMGILYDNETSEAFAERLPLTITLQRYGEREYYASIPELPETGEVIPTFENGDITYFTSGGSLAIFFSGEESSRQGGLIRMGRITSDLGVLEAMPETITMTISLSEDMALRDFDFDNVEIIGADLNTFNEEELAVLYQQARYSESMTEGDTTTMREITSPDKTFTHMSGRTQSREEYFADIESGRLRYFSIGIEEPVVNIDGNLASISYTSVLNANAYGARGTYRIRGTHWFENRNGEWTSINNPDR